MPTTYASTRLVWPICPISGFQLSAWKCIPRRSQEDVVHDIYISTNLQLYVTECNWGYHPYYTYIYIYIYTWGISCLRATCTPKYLIETKKLRKYKTNTPQVLYMLELKQQLRTKTTTTTTNNNNNNNNDN